MKTIKLIRLTSGEEIIAEQEDVPNSTNILIKDAIVLIPAGEGKIGIMPFMPYTKANKGLELRGQDIYQVYCHTTEIRGREEYFVDNYEPPTENFIDMDTTNKSVKECIDEILDVCR